MDLLHVTKLLPSVCKLNSCHHMKLWAKLFLKNQNSNRISPAISVHEPKILRSFLTLQSCRYIFSRIFKIYVKDRLINYIHYIPKYKAPLNFAGQQLITLSMICTYDVHKNCINIYEMKEICKTNAMISFIQNHKFCIY